MSSNHRNRHRNRDRDRDRDSSGSRDHGHGHRQHHGHGHNHRNAPPPGRPPPHLMSGLLPNPAFGRPGPPVPVWQNGNYDMPMMQIPMPMHGNFQQQQVQNWPIRGGGIRGAREEYEQQNFPRGGRRDGRDYHDHGRGRGGFEFDRNPRERSREDHRSRGGNERERRDPPPGFNLDTRAERINVSSVRSLAYSQTPSYSRTIYADNMFGASEEYIKKLPGARFRDAIPKVGIDEFGNIVDAKTEEPIENEDGSYPAPLVLETTPNVRRKSNPNASAGALKPVTFLSLAPPRTNSSRAGSSKNPNRIDFGNSLNLSNSQGLRDKTEEINIKLRADPKNISLWRELVQFQDQTFEEANQFEGEGDEESQGQEGGKKKKKTKKKKALIEIKIAVLDKALAANPKSIELCVDKLDLCYEIYKPNYVLTEWKKLTSTNQETAAFWFEYLRYPSTQLQLFNTTSTGQLFEKTVLKFRSMCTQSYQKFQRPPKSPLVLADILGSLCFLLKNAGLIERAVAIHQAQIEMDFDVPEEVARNKSVEDWKKTCAALEKFWDSGSVRYGEPGARGWKNQMKEQDQESQKPPPTFILDAAVSSFEDDFFLELVDDNIEPRPSDSAIWLAIESLRSKAFWVPWRAPTGEPEDDPSCEDNQRFAPIYVVLPYLSNVSAETYASDFERQSVQFRHLINFLLTLREDFLPRTHTLDSILAPFVNYSLSDSRTLFTEIFYWKKWLNLYHQNVNRYAAETDSSEIPIPESFRLNEFTVPSQAAEIENQHKLMETNSTIQESKEALLVQSEINHLNFVRAVVEQSLNHLDSKFAALIVQALLRFEQRNNYNNRRESHKARMKYVKNLMKHEKLRGAPAVGVYGEVAMLEYFGGGEKSKERAIDLLIKTINSSGSTLQGTKEGEEIDLAKDFEQVADVTKLYRILTELHLRENPAKALTILVALGNKFAPIEIGSEISEAKPTTNALLKAKKFYEFVHEWIFPKSAGEDQVEAPEFGEKLNGDKSVEFLLQDSNLIVEWTTVYALFKFLSGGSDFESANELFVEVTEITKPKEPLSRSTRYDSNVVFRHHIREQLYINWSKLSALVLSSSPMQNSKFRNTLCTALQDFPSSPPLLLLFTDVESQCSIVGKLWRAMVNIVKQDTSQNTYSLYWAPLFMTFGLAQQIEKLEQDEAIGLDTFGLGGPAVPPDTIFYKLDALLTAAEENTLSRNVPMIWRIHLKHLVMRANVGKDVRRARSLFYEAIRHCPSSKAIYMDGITYFPEMTKEIQDLMTEKGIMVRLPREELDLLLAIDQDLEKEKEAMELEKQKKMQQSESQSESESEHEQGPESPSPPPSPAKTKKRKKTVDSSNEDFKPSQKKKKSDPEVIEVLSDGEIDDD